MRHWAPWVAMALAALAIAGAWALYKLDKHAQGIAAAIAIAAAAVIFAALAWLGRRNQ